MLTPHPQETPHSHPLPPFTPSKSHLLTLITSKQYKSFRMYIDELSKQNQKAEKAIAQVLTEIFLQKKYKVPAIMFSALVFYKNLITSAIFDYLCQESLFPQKIHSEIGEICRYKGKQKDIQKRGSSYFSFLFNLESNEQNAGFGYNYILLALQTLKSISKWYPTDFLQPQKPSTFKAIYDDMLREGVYFPQEQDFAFMKQKDIDLFHKNYENYKKIMKALLQEEQKIQKKEENIEIKILKPIKQKVESEESELLENENNSLNVVSTLGLSTAIKMIGLDESDGEEQKKKKKDGTAEMYKAKRTEIIIPNPPFQQRNIEKIAYHLNLKQYPPKNEKSRQKRSNDKYNASVKLQRTQRSGFARKFEQPIYERIETENSCQEEFRPMRSSSHRSLPKTERLSMLGTPTRPTKSKNIVQEPLNFNTSKIQLQDPLDPKILTSVISQKLSMTLSKSSFNRRELNIQDSISRYKDLTSIFYKLKLRYDLCDLHEKKYKPLHLGMTSLLDQSLKFYDFSDGEDPFYRGDKIEARLIKQNGYNFRLSLRNMGDQALLVAFKDMSKYKYSNQIRVISWGNKKLHNFNSMYQDFSVPLGQSVGPSHLTLNTISSKFLTFASHSLPKQSYLDIRFSFFTADPGLKFLPFDLSINGGDFFLILPLTILDLCSIHQQFSPFQLQRYGQNNRGNFLMTRPFVLRHKRLPSSLGGFEFKDFYPKNIDYLHYNLIGCCKLDLPAEDYLKSSKRSIYIMVRLVSYPKRAIELMSIYNRDDREEDHFAREILNLLQFQMMESVL